MFFFQTGLKDMIQPPPNSNNNKLIYTEHSLTDCIPVRNTRNIYSVDTLLQFNKRLVQGFALEQLNRIGAAFLPPLPPPDERHNSCVARPDSSQCTCTRTSTRTRNTGVCAPLESYDHLPHLHVPLPISLVLG